MEEMIDKCLVCMEVKHHVLVHSLRNAQAEVNQLAVK